jgi:DNA modification methylase
MLKIEYIKASELKPNPNNAKLHPDSQIAQIVRSIKEYGMDDPIAVWGEDNTIIEGHGRLLACQKLGIDEVPIIRLDHLTDKQRRAYTLIHNQLTMNTGFDVQKLTAELEAIGDNLIEYGFDIKPHVDIIEDEPGDVEEETYSEQGKCYRMGDHLIYCGSFADAAVADMFAKEKAACTFTDPPYNVAVKNRSTGKTIQNDNMAHDKFQEFLNEAMTIVHAYTQPGGGVLSWMSDTELTTLKNAFDYSGLNFRTVICWVKSQFTLGGNDFQSAKEMAIYGLGEGKFDATQGDEADDAQFACYGRGKGGKFTDSRKLSNVWFFEKPRSNKDHPTMKPIGLCAKGVMAMSDPGDIVFDPFSGSGSTMIACQQTGRRCFGCELDPRYADVIRRRYVKFVYGSEDNWQELTPEEEL